MICETKTEAQRVAWFGSLKMSELAYTLVRTETFGEFRVVKHSDRSEYRVNVGVPSAAHRSCTCPFFVANGRFRVCKHLYWVLAQEEQQARWDAMVKEAGAGLKG
jgi:hypothetical protein